MVIKIALFLELFRFLQFVVKQDKTSLCSSSSQLHSPRGGNTALARLGLFARSTKTAMLRAGYTFIFLVLLSQFAALGETLLRTLTLIKAWKYAGTGEYDISLVQYFAAHFVVRLSNFYTMAQKH